MNRPHETYSDRDVHNLATGKDEAAIRRAIDHLVEEKKAIEMQLAEAKNTPGVPDLDWRRSAIKASQKKDLQIIRLRSRLRQVVAGGISATGKPAPERRALVMRGTPDEVAENLQSWIDDGWTPVHSIALLEAVVVVMRADFVSVG